MSLEKPVQTIRKAIIGAAEELASKELLDKPEQRHIDKAINMYKTLRAYTNEDFKKKIMYDAERKKLKDEMGLYAYKVFNEVWDTFLKGPTGLEEKSKEAMKQIRETKKPTVKEIIQQGIEFRERFLKEKGELLKIDPRIISTFLGKEEILNKKIDLEISDLMDMYYAHDLRRKL